MRVGCFLLLFPAFVWGRPWTDKSGKFSVEGEIEFATETIVIIRSPDNTFHAINVESLDVADQESVQSYRANRDQRQHQLEQRLAHAWSALEERRIDRAREILNDAKSLIGRENQRTAIDDYVRMVDQVDGLWRAFPDAVGKLKPNDELLFARVRVTVSSVSGESFVIRAAGNQYKIPVADRQSVPDFVVIAVIEKDAELLSQHQVAIQLLRRLKRKTFPSSLLVAKVPTKPLPIHDRPVPPANSLKPVPTQPQMNRSIELFKTAYAGQLQQAADTPAKLELAQAIFHQALESVDENHVDAYVMLLEAAKLYATAGRLKTSCETFDEIPQRFDVDNVIQRKSDVLTTHNLVPQDHNDVIQFVDLALRVLDEAGRKGEFQVIPPLTTKIRSAVTPLRRYNPTLATALINEAARFATIQRRAKQTERALQALSKTPDDPDANLAVGVYRCFVQQQWEDGLTHLNDGSDPELAALATADQSNPEIAADQAALAERWWNLASEDKYADYSAALKQRATTWYERALPELKALAKGAAEKRIQEGLDTSGSGVAQVIGYLSDLSPTKEQGTVVATSDESPTVRIAKVDVHHAVTMTNTAEAQIAAVEYSLSGRFVALSGVVGVAGEAPPAENPTPVVFQIKSDKKTLWTSQPLIPGRSQPFRVSVTGVEQLYLATGSPKQGAIVTGLWGNLLLVKK